MFRKLEKVEMGVEDLFIRHYDRMLGWALHLTDHRAEQAEDLVHDAFVQLTLSPPDFAAIENFDGYLFVVLRNLHRYQLQRGTRGPIGPESTVDYDSAEAGLKAADPRQQLQVVEELRLTCRYACERKESSKAGSVLILRFFHGYYPGEIAGILCVSRPAVKELLRAARAEAKLYIADPARLDFIAGSAAENNFEIKTGSSIDEVVSGLRRAIYTSRQGCCPERNHLREIYDAQRPELLTPPLLGHIVSCPACLEEVNRLLNLPPLSDRDPNDMLGPDRIERGSGKGGSQSPFGSGSKSRARRISLQRYRRRLREVYEHEPRELRIAVNGFVLAQQEVAAAVNKQTLGIEVAEELALIEVLSEQGVRLLALHVQPPPAGQFEQRARAELSDGRTIEVTLSFCGSWPHLEIVYECRTSDCGLRSADCGLEADRDDPGLAPSTLNDFSLEPQSLWPKLKSATRNPQSAINWLLRPVTITVLLVMLLVAVVLGQKLGLWLHRATPSAIPSSRESRPGKPQPDTPPSVTPNAEPNSGGGRLTPSPTASPAVHAMATAELEIELLRLLQQAKADLHEQIEVKRTPQNKLRVEGIIETDARKAELLFALAAVRGHPAVESRCKPSPKPSTSASHRLPLRPSRSSNATRSPISDCRWMRNCAVTSPRAESRWKRLTKRSGALPPQRSRIHARRRATPEP